MRIGLIDVDGHNFPNLPLMKLSAWHKKQGDRVEWYSHLMHWKTAFDRVYMGKVFTASPDYPYMPFAGEIVKGGTGYYYPDGGPALDPAVENICPDYSLYPQYTKNTAYGFLTRGCPRGCEFCIVGKKEGRISHHVADLGEFWTGQQDIVLIDPNITASKDCEALFSQLIASGSRIDFSQGIDIRLMDDKKAWLLKQMRIKMVHFAWDNPADKNIIIPKLKEFKRITGWDKRKMTVYVLVNFNSTLEEDLERVYTIRELGYWPYVMVYEREKLPKGHIMKKLQRWVNRREVFETVRTFEEYIGK